MIEKKLQINEEGCSIRCRYFCNDSRKNERRFKHVAIVTHGFGSSKDTAGVTNFAQHLTSKYKDDAVIAFDFPCHGEDARKKLLMDECLKYLAIVTDYAKKTLGAEKVYNYSTSFGAYVTLRFLLEKGNPFTRIALRAPAVTIDESMNRYLTEADRSALKKGKEIQVGFDRKMKIDQAFLDDLRTHDVRKSEFFDFADDLIILHGTKDEMIPFEEAKAFAENNVITFIPIEGANHPFQNPKQMALAIHEIVEFFGE